VEGGGGGLTVSGVSRNRGGFVKCVAIRKRLKIPDIRWPGTEDEVAVVPETSLLRVEGLR
jgi:hypothetical protein